jgi:SulP family sulfate permease
MGLTRVGSLIRFIPVSIIIGFTNGIAVLIALSQVKEFLGLRIEGKIPAEFFALIHTLWSHVRTIDPGTVSLGLASLAVILLWPRIVGRLPGRLGALSRLPGTIVALALATLATALLQLPVETIGSKFGGIPQMLPAFALPEFNWETARNLVTPTITIALLGAIESLLCARVADGMIDDRHDPNQELMAQGVANFLGPFFGCIPATGTIARTTTNVRSGASTPVAGIIHAFVLLTIILVAAPVAKHVPLVVLAAILLFVAYNMGEWSEFPRLKQFSMPYRVTMVSTFLLTVMLDLTVAVEVGLILACLFFIYRISSLTSVEPIIAETLPAGISLPDRVCGYRLFGSLFFGSVGKLEALLEIEGENARAKAMVLDLHHVINIDTTGLETLDVLRKSLARRGCALILCDVNDQPRSLMQRAGFAEDLGVDNLLADIPSAMAQASRLLAGQSATVA